MLFAALLAIVSLAFTAPGAPAIPALKDAFQDCFLVGAALHQGQFSEQQPERTVLITRHFNSISPENVLKWESVHPHPDGYDFTGADQYVAFGEKYKMTILGHTLVWHHQTPKWVFEDQQGKPVDRETLLKTMGDHVHTVIGRYKGRIKGWDVVNEALSDDGRLRDSPWLKIIGPDYLAKAFEFARAADPQAELYYNDYSLENRPKREGAVKLIKDLQSRGITVAAVGLQGHYKMDRPAPIELDATIRAFSALGVKCMITELDVDVLPPASRRTEADVNLREEMKDKLNPYVAGLPAEIQQKLARRYADLFSVFVKNRAAITRVTFWGVTDGDSWLNYWPVRGRSNYPLLFDRAGKPKPAFDEVLKTAKSIPSGAS